MAAVALVVGDVSPAAHWAFCVCGLVALAAVPVALLFVRRTETEIAQATASAQQREVAAPAPD